MAPCPYLMDSDLLSLNTAFVVHYKKLKLYDRSIDAAHNISSRSIVIMKALQEGVKLSELYRVAHQHTISPEEIRIMLGELNYCGGLVRQRSYIHHVLAIAQIAVHSTRRVFFPLLIWRRTASISTIGSAIIRASTPLMIASLFVVALLMLSDRVPAHQVWNVSCCALFTFLLSAIVHEQAHWIFIRSKGLTASIVQQSLRVGLIHKRLEPRAEIQCALIGPLAGCLASSAALLWPWRFSAIPFIGISLGVLHLCGLLPFYGDGKSILQALNIYRKNKNIL